MLTTINTAEELVDKFRELPVDNDRSLREDLETVVNSRFESVADPYTMPDAGREAEQESAGG